MNHKKKFVSPKVLKEVPVQLERNLLGDSIQYNTKVLSMGQEVENYDISDSGDFTVEWD